MKRILTAALITATLAGPAAALGVTFPIFTLDLQFPEEGAFDKNNGKRARAAK